MNVKTSVLHMIHKHMPVPVAILETSHLYTDLLFDSLAYITLLTAIEEHFSITFAIDEMEMLLQVEKLIKAVENKIGKRGPDHD